MKPLKTCRKLFSWFCPEVIEQPLNKNQLRSREAFRFMIEVIAVATAFIFNSLLLTNHISVNDIDSVFFGFSQFNGTLYVTSLIIGTFKSGPKLASLFRSLDNIYETCKNLPALPNISKLKLKYGWSPIPDPDKRLTKANKTCASFYPIFIASLTKWNAVAIALISAASILICQLKYGFGQIESAELFRLVKAVWVLNEYFTKMCSNDSSWNFHCSWPWSQESLLGYIGEVVANIIMFNTIMGVALQLFLLFISVCVHIFTFNKMFASLVNKVDHASDEEEKNAIFRRLVGFHLDIKRCGFIRLKFGWCILIFLVGFSGSSPSRETYWIFTLA